MSTDRTRQDTLVRIASCAARHAVRLRSRVACPAPVWGLWRCCGAALGRETVRLRDCGARGRLAWSETVPDWTRRLCYMSLRLFSSLEPHEFVAAGWVRVRCYNYVMSRLSTVGSINLARSQPAFEFESLPSTRLQYSLQHRLALIHPDTRMRLIQHPQLGPPAQPRSNLLPMMKRHTCILPAIPQQHR
jgi:hypothetical protein